MARTLVHHRNFKECIAKIENNPYKRRALDTETTGLKPYNGHRLFSIIISTKEDDFYFNFNTSLDNTGTIIPIEFILPKAWLADFKPMLEDKSNTWYMHNAKFELHMLHVDGLEVLGRVWCTSAMARLVQNRLPSLKLSKLGELIGHKKDDAVEKYISKHKLYTLVDVGKKEPRKDKHFQLVPFDIITDYGLTDGRVTFELGEYEQTRLEEMNKEQVSLGLPPLSAVVENEIKLTKTLYKVEQKGIKIDRVYTQKAYNYEISERNDYAEKFLSYTGEDFQDSPTLFKKVFKKLGLKPAKTLKGNDSYSEANLPDNAVTELIVAWRKHNKRAGTYFRNFLDLADENDILHCNFRQDGTVTGRMSASDPNLQNVPKRGEDESKYPVRKCFIPREGHFFAMIDFDQMEYRLLLDIAGETEVIRKINEDGLDVHTATAEEMGTERDPAKTLNFMLLYGGGAAKLALTLGILLSKAKQLKSKYFSTLKFVKALVNALTDTSKNRGFIVNWLGRRIHLDTVRPYTMPNHYIQGGCGDAAKIAKNKIAAFIKENTLDMEILLSVHDELILEVPFCEKDNLQIVKEIMENVYPAKSLKLTAGIDIGVKNWFDKAPFFTGKLTLENMNLLGKRYVDAWTSIRGQRERCTNEKSKCFKHYGGKGVNVTYDTRTFISWYVTEAKKFKEDIRLNVDRLDHDKNYTYTNVRLITQTENVIESNQRRKGV